MTGTWRACARCDGAHARCDRGGSVSENRPGFDDCYGLVTLTSHPCVIAAAKSMARILVIEDEADIRQVLEYNLRMAGHDVVAAERGQDGLRLLREQQPDLVLLDLMLPDVPGTEVCRSIKDDVTTRAIPVIMLTARDEEIDRVVGFELAPTIRVNRSASRNGVEVVPRWAKRKQTAGIVQRGFGKLRTTGRACIWVEGKNRTDALEFKLVVTSTTAATGSVSRRVAGPGVGHGHPKSRRDVDAP